MFLNILKPELNVKMKTHLNKKNIHCKLRKQKEGDGAVCLYVVFKRSVQ